MFHTYTTQSTSFQDWLKAANQLYLTQYLFLGGRKKDYRPLQHHLKPHPQDQYLLYIDDQRGICGSAIITPLSDDFEIEGQHIPQGTWALGYVLFCAKARLPFCDQTKIFDRLITHFHEGLFDHLWHLAQVSGHHLALSFQTDPAIHQDLTFFGGFTFQTAKYLDDDPQNLSIAIMPVTAETYQSYQKTKNKNVERLEVDPCLFFPKQGPSIFEVKL